MPQLPTQPHVRAWWESPIVLALVGAFSVHLVIATVGDALVVLNPPRPAPPPPPKVEMFDIVAPPEVKPPPPPVTPPEPEPAPQPTRPATAPARIAAHAPARNSEPPATDQPPTTSTPSPEGGGPVVSMPDVAPGATGVGVQRGAVNPGHVGRGGHGTGTGAGEGSGAADVPAPMSVATIKTRAMPKSDYAHEEIKDFPAEAKRLGIEGKIRVKLIVDAQGIVKSALLLNKLGYGLDELAMSRAKSILFDPAKDTDDRPVASVVVWTFDMVPPK